MIWNNKLYYLKSYSITFWMTYCFIKFRFTEFRQSIEKEVWCHIRGIFPKGYLIFICSTCTIVVENWTLNFNWHALWTFGYFRSERLQCCLRRSLQIMLQIGVELNFQKSFQTEIQVGPQRSLQITVYHDRPNVFKLIIELNLLFFRVLIGQL